MAKLIGIMASTPEGGIASNGKLPWNRPPDGKWFQQVTRNHTVIMGRKTFNEIIAMTGRPLQHRNNAVLTTMNLTTLTARHGLLRHMESELGDYSITVPVDGNVELWLNNLLAESENAVFVIGGLETLKTINALHPLDEFWHTVSDKPVDHEPDVFLELPGWDFRDIPTMVLYEPEGRRRVAGSYTVYHRFPIVKELSTEDKQRPVLLSETVEKTTEQLSNESPDSDGMLHVVVGDVSELNPFAGSYPHGHQRMIYGEPRPASPYMFYGHPTSLADTPHSGTSEHDAMGSIRMKPEFEFKDRVGGLYSSSYVATLKEALYKVFIEQCGLAPDSKEGLIIKELLTKPDISNRNSVRKVKALYKFYMEFNLLTETCTSILPVAIQEVLRVHQQERELFDNFDQRMKEFLKQSQSTDRSFTPPRGWHDGEMGDHLAYLAILDAMAPKTFTVNITMDDVVDSIRKIKDRKGYEDSSMGWIPAGVVESIEVKTIESISDLPITFITLKDGSGYKISTLMFYTKGSHNVTSIPLLSLGITRGETTIAYTDMDVSELIKVGDTLYQPKSDRDV